MLYYKSCKVYQIEKYLEGFVSKNPRLERTGALERQSYNKIPPRGESSGLTTKWQEFVESIINLL